MTVTLLTYQPFAPGCPVRRECDHRRRRITGHRHSGGGQQQCAEI
jgi:hypothetical protein